MKRLMLLMFTTLFLISCEKTYYYVDYKWDEKYTIEKGNYHKYKAKDDSAAVDMAKLYLEGLIDAQRIIQGNQIEVKTIYLKVDVLNSNKQFIRSVYNKNVEYNGE